MSQQDRHPLLDTMNAARRFRLSPEAEERILDTLRQAEETIADGRLFDHPRSPWSKWRNNWRPAAAACLAVIIVGGAVGVGYRNGAFQRVEMDTAQTAATKSAAHGPILSEASASRAQASSSAQETGPASGTASTVTGEHSSALQMHVDGPLVTSLFQQKKSDVLPTKKVHVTGVKSTDLPANTPVAEAYLESNTFTLSNGRTVSSSMNDLLWSISLDQHCVVAAVIPGTYPEEDQVGLMIKRNGQWTLESDISMQRSTSYSQQNLKGLNVPKNTLLEAGPAGFYDNKHGQAWMFYTSNGMAAIAKYKASPYGLPSGGKHFMVRAKNAWLFSGLRGQDSLAYMTVGGTIVAVGGNLTPAQSKALLASLPPLTNPNFPFWHS